MQRAEAHWQGLTLCHHIQSVGESNFTTCSAKVPSFLQVREFAPPHLGGSVSISVFHSSPREKKNCDQLPQPNQLLRL